MKTRAVIQRSELARRQPCIPTLVLFTYKRIFRNTEKSIGFPSTTGNGGSCDYMKVSKGRLTSRG